MRIWFTILIAMMVLTPTRGWADESGKVCVTDGKTVVVNGKRWRGACRGGTVFELEGVVTPSLDQLCDTTDGRRWYCGRAAAAMLLEYVKERVVECKAERTKKDGTTVGTCRVEGVNLSDRMVAEGWALADRTTGIDFVAAETQARQARKGLWQGGVVPPW